VRRCQKKFWLVVAVLKQDLWCSDQSTVAQYYETDGSFAQELSQLAQICNQATFRYEVRYASLIISNFVSGNRSKILKRNSAGYDQSVQVESAIRLIETIHSLSTWSRDHA
jgi:hypothetical protein